ncbi:hypothetical protein [Nonomuraea sp. NPDC049709]|uniref:phage tail tube protein n=1 Tax=Nonomuraea sp. NPDC049709 TaxID=3154736 RepID=UPI00341E469F
MTGWTWQIETEGRRKRTDDPVFTPDPGQEKIRRASQIVGFNANIRVRWFRRDGAPDACQGICTVIECTEGGEATDLEPFSFYLARPRRAGGNHVVRLLIGDFRGVLDSIMSAIKGFGDTIFGTGKGVGAGARPPDGGPRGARRVVARRDGHW